MLKPVNVFDYHRYLEMKRRGNGMIGARTWKSSKWVEAMDTTRLMVEAKHSLSSSREGFLEADFTFRI